ncbi:hypothetical protein [Streptacidiphilus cavernicola]|uniref:Lipoprotein n=1 Tax=Streptacidiphilus cavernicola TaxID=3342716 RepID=A0ABV6W235_9ACTN
MTGQVTCPARRSIAALLGASLLCLPLAGCTASAKENASPTTSVTQELSILKSAQNGLYYQPFLRSEPAGPEDNSYAMRIRSALNDHTKVDPNAKTAAFFRSESLASSPLIGREWLAPLTQSGMRGLLTQTDADTVRGMRTKGGWFTEPHSGSPDNTANRAAATAAALEVLQSSGGITLADRNATLPWLARIAASQPGLGQEAADLATSFHLLGAPVPAALAGIQAPTAPDFAGMSEQDRYQALLSAYQYAVIVTAAGRRADLDPSVWGPVLEHNAATLGFQDLYDVVYVAKAAGVPSAAFTGARKRMAADTLPDGTVRDPSAYIGDPESSLYALLLRRLAGESTRDASLAKALQAVAATPEVTGDPLTLLTTTAAWNLASGNGPSASVTRLCRTPTAVPATVTMANAAAWERAELACEADGVQVSAPRVESWPLSGAQQVAAAATLVVGLADDQSHFQPPAWITAQDLRPWAEHPERMPSADYYAMIVRAYLLLGGKADAAIDAAVDSGINPLRHCAQLPNLYQADHTDGCDLVTTWSVWTLKDALGGHAPISTAAPDTTEKK